MEEALKLLVTERHSLVVKAGFSSLSLSRISQKVALIKRVVHALGETKTGLRKARRASRTAVPKRDLFRREK